MSLNARHGNTGNGSTVGTYSFSGNFFQVSVINRSTNDIYWTSLPSQGTASDGVPTVSGNHCYYVSGTGTPQTSFKTVSDCCGGNGTDYVTVSWICTVTNSPFSIIAE